MDELDCLECGDEILVEGEVYYDGQSVTCPGCGLEHFVCCDSETDIHLHICDE